MDTGNAVSEPERAIVSSKDESTDVQLDISKYEGHTPAPWKAFEDIESDGYKTGAWTVGNATSKSLAPPLHFTDEHDPHTYSTMGICLLQPINQNNEANAKLIADAPLLLEKVKRLREEISKWTAYATYVENVNMDCHQDACAEAGFLWKCSDCGAHFELPEDGIYECEFGCDASD